MTGTGWVNVNLAAITGGSPLSSLPLDPVNDATNYYAFERTSILTYEIDANMESAKYVSGGGSDVESNNKDGGNNGIWYEVGNDAALDL